MKSQKLRVPLLAFALLVSAGCSGTGSDKDVSATPDMAEELGGGEDLVSTATLASTEQDMAPAPDLTADVADVPAPDLLDEELPPEIVPAEVLEEIEETAPELPCDETCTECGVANGCGDICFGDDLCDDDNLCTTDSCQPDEGCVFAANTIPCNDGDACTSSDTCADGECVGASLDCDDGNPCTDDSCDADSGCVFENNTEPCDDNSDCTMEDVCDAGECMGAGSLECDDANPCTVDVCLDDGGCEYEPVDGPCSDDDVCTAGDLCLAGECVPGEPVVCSDDNPCTTDSCAPDAGCVFTNNDSACSDANPCTLADACLDGACVGEPVECAPGEYCLDGACVCADPCGEAECGEDACGSSCGVCGDGLACVDGTCVEAGPECPPPPPYGTSIGKTLPNATLLDCDGVEYSIHDLCPSKAAWIFLYTGW